MDEKRAGALRTLCINNVAAASDRGKNTRTHAAIGSMGFQETKSDGRSTQEG
jgi:hypothetical protein